MGENLIVSWEIIAPFGCLVEIGKSDVRTNAMLHMAHFARNATFSAVERDTMCGHWPVALRRTLLAVINLVAQENIGTVYLVNMYPVLWVEGAFVQVVEILGKT